MRSKVINMKPLSNFNKQSIIFGLIALVCVVTLFKLMIVVEAGKRVVLFNVIFGVEKRTLTEGLHLVIPYIETPNSYSVRSTSYSMVSREREGPVTGDDALDCLTSDGQKIKVEMSVIYNLIPEEVWMLHKEVGREFEDNIVRPQIRSVTRNTFASYPVGEIYSSKRRFIQEEIYSKLKTALGRYHINVTEALIRNVEFSEAFAKAIEQKQVALQDVERMRYQVDREKLEKQRKIIEAEGESEAIRQKAAVLKTNPLLVQYEYVSKLAPGIRTIVTDQKSIMNFPSELLQK
ncbi:MAG TPA: protease [Cyanobacteria bacterium UBA8530]|nr:protease [Cyanobacteria bacterium UBA8530]